MTRSKGNIVTEDNVVRVVQRLIRKSNKVIKAIVPPFPISSPNPLRFLFPAEGKVIRVVVGVDGMPKEGVVIVARLVAGDLVGATEITTKKNIIKDLDLDVKAGDRLDIDVKPIGDGEFQACYIACLWVTKVREAKVKSYLIDELDKLEEENAREIGEETEAQASKESTHNPDNNLLNEVELEDFINKRRNL